MKLIIFFLLTLFLPSCSVVQRVFHGKNYVDKDMMRQGKWVHSVAGKVASKGRFKDDRPAKKWKYYDQGILVRKEYYKQKGNGTAIKTKFFHPNGKVEKKGWAKVEYDTAKTHYYWEGEWYYFSEEGELTAIKLFQKNNPEPEILMEQKSK